MVTQPAQVPSVGRMVHYTSYGTPGGEYTSMCRAAIITAVYVKSSDEFSVDLCVLNPEGMFFNRNIIHDEERRGGTWHWPERV